MCDEFRAAPGCFGGDGMQYERAWVRRTHASCSPHVQVFRDGRVSLIHPGSTDASLAPDSGNVFRVHWASGFFPAVADQSCANGCVAGARATCTCEAEVETSAAFADVVELPSATDSVAQSESCRA